MLQRKQFVRKTKKGSIQKVVREHYLRDDISSGTPLDAACPPEDAKLSADAPHYLVVDTNVALHQMDFLEHAAVNDVIVMGVVLDEVRHRNSAVHQRLRALTQADAAKRCFVFSNEHHRETYVKAEPGESANDRNDRAIRVAAAWYARKLAGKVPVLLLSNDAENLRRAGGEGLNAMSVQAYARTRTDAPELVDLVAAAGEAAAAADSAAGVAEGREAKRARIYEDHRAMSAITEGIKQGRLHQGTLRVDSYNRSEAWVASESVGRSILIPDSVAMNRAVDGDVVAVELLPEAEWRGPSQRLPGAEAETEAGEEEAEAAEEGAHLAAQVAPAEPEGRAGGASEQHPAARVVGIIRRNWRGRGYAGSLVPPKPGAAPRRGGWVLFQPVEKRFPRVRISTRQADTLMDKRIVVAIDGWEADSRHPSGHYVRTLGTIGDRDTETDVLLLENDINTQPFSQAVHDCVPHLPWAVSEADVCEPHREDLRHLLVCSVDPPGCKDIDDALHIRELPSGSLELGVHIADVTHFLLPGSAMDAEAAARGTTTYLVQRRIDMLPKPLTEDICSLRSGVDRLAFSVLWELDAGLQTVGVRFTKSVIRSAAALTYEEAQSRIDDARLQDGLSRGLRRLNCVAKALRRRRAERGALTLASAEVKFQIDTETHDPLDVGMYQVREANQMVEEMMLLANCTVAERILNSFPACALLRRHPVPPPRQFEPLLRAAGACGVTLDVASSAALAASLDTAVRPDDPFFNKLVRILATRCMTQAQYFGSGECSPPEYVHYGLASPLYTHFTSPIRRYADVMVHRLLAASLGLSQLPEASKDRATVRGLADNLNTRHRNAQTAGRASVELHTLIFFRNRAVLADARITRVRANGLIVFVPKYGIEGPVYLTPRPERGAPAAGAPAAAAAEADLVLDEDKQTVKSRDGATCYTVFDKVAVRIAVEEGTGHRRHLALELVDRAQLPASELATA